MAGADDLDEAGEDVLRRDVAPAAGNRHYHILIRTFGTLDTVEKIEALDREELKMRLERMQTHFYEAEAAYMALPDAQGADDENDSDFFNMEARFVRVSADINRRLRHLEEIEQARTTPVNPTATIVRLETPHVPDVGTFNGDPEAWPPFRNLFLSEVHNREMADSKKLRLLKKALVGKATSTLGNWDLEADGYQEAWKAMLEVYDDDYNIVHGLLGRLFAVARPEKESYDSMRSISDSVTGAFRALKSYKHHEALNEQLWVHIGTRLLPASALDGWEQHRRQLGLKHLPRLSEWAAYCAERSSTRRNFEVRSRWENKETSAEKSKAEPNRTSQDNDKSKIGSGNSRFRPQNRHSAHAGASSSSRIGGPTPSRPTSCVMQDCKESHNVWTCEKFRSLTLTDRLAAVRKHRLCNCCLMPGHFAYNCDRLTYACSKCPDDKTKHHFRLCPKTTLDTKPAVRRPAEAGQKKEASGK